MMVRRIVPSAFIFIFCPLSDFQGCQGSPTLTGDSRTFFDVPGHWSGTCLPSPKPNCWIPTLAKFKSPQSISQSKVIKFRPSPT
ncbi:hypothetical protein F4677DRAFT_1923 [Hypoxylon crocopeplum]|nr:hypothetical protein F4677DRAFT_1923 [Hypoxylon crocopeplum]